jgi:NAD(P)-dependent dehydrogenase (short-subunit alcohol dehydrogenase family)
LRRSDRFGTSSPVDVTELAKNTSLRIPATPTAPISSYLQKAGDYPSAMASSLSGKIAFVTGGASGIGAALTNKLVDGGAEVWIADRQIDRAQELAQRLESRGGKAHAIELDVRDYASFERAAAEVVRQSGRIDYLFNNAGIGVAGEVDSYTVDDWDDVIDVNLRGVTNGIQAVYPIMIRQHSGHIVNTASMAGLMTTTSQASYTATKHAVVAISKTLRLEAKRHGVQVSVLCPGVIRTPILTGGEYGRTKMTGVSDDELLKFWERSRPMPPELFAERALRAVLRGEAIIVVPTWWKAFWYLERLSPALSMRLATVLLKRVREVESLHKRADRAADPGRKGLGR